MKARILGFALLSGFAPLAAAAGGPTDTERAQAATAAFASALKSELVQAMQTGGPTEAIAVCHERAGVIAETVSREQGVAVSRVSLKNRNPGNAPNEWQRAVLEDFEVRRSSGEPPGDLAWQDTVDTDAGREFRYMKAIPTGGLCLRCHGEVLDAEVTERLSELYPDDRATGFREGDLRGAFVVTRPIEP